MSIYVVFFGGYNASQTDMDLWLASAQKQRKDVDFDAFPYPPGAKSDDTSAVSGFSNQFAGVIKKIEESGADPTYIVGHSSGCAIANKLDSRLKDHSHITLVALDGFHPDADQMNRSSTQIWSAVGGGGKSLHFDQLKKLYGSRLQVYKATTASNKWSLHFSLVNTAATNSIQDSKNGYAGCVANLVWLK
jgi:hypothetical protein